MKLKDQQQNSCILQKPEGKVINRTIPVATKKMKMREKRRLQGVVIKRLVL